MPWVTITERQSRSFVPHEATALAARFRKAAARMREQSDELRRIWATLDDSWDGVSNETFNQDFGPRPGQLGTYAEWLEAAAGDPERTQVTVWETVEREAWVD